MTEAEIINFKKKEKVGVSISVSKENLDKLRAWMEKNDKEAPLSLPFDAWLEMWVQARERADAEAKNQKEQPKEGDKNEPQKF